MNMNESDNESVTQKVRAFESVTQRTTAILSPPEIYAKIAQLGYEKAHYPWWKVILLSIVAGGYVGLGATTCFLIGGMMKQAPWNPNVDEQNYGVFKLVFGAVGFPFAFMTIVVCGSELFTSQCAYTTVAWLEQKIVWWQVIKMLTLTWMGNFIGCLITAGLFYFGNVYDHKDMYLKYATREKLDLPWGVVFVRGIFANWLVAIATWMANAALDVSGKAIAIWLPISAFAAIGLEHCIANMFILMMGRAQGVEFGAKEFMWYNLIPASLGNWVGGAVFMAIIYSYIYGRPIVFMRTKRV